MLGTEFASAGILTAVSVRRLANSTYRHRVEIETRRRYLEFADSTHGDSSAVGRTRRFAYHDAHMASHNTRLIRLIGLFKLFKAFLLIAVGVGALKMIHSDVTDIALRIVTKLGLDPGGRYVGKLLVGAANLTPDKIRDLGVGSFLYAGLFLTEGIGLCMAKRWAEWFSVIITSSLVPFEIYEIHHHPTLLKFGALLLNIAVVAYLVYRIRTDDAAPRQPSKR